MPCAILLKLHLHFTQPERGTVPKGERMVCELCYHSHSVNVLDHYQVSLKILNGNKYNIRLSGVAHKPKLDFSFYDYDFGPSFIDEPGLTPYVANLIARNGDSQNVSFDLLYESTEYLT
eukprot:scaffold37546_cov45-Prasinocladus_malaysianus.AAC.1